MDTPWTQLAELITQLKIPPHQHTQLQQLLFQIHQQHETTAKTAKKWNDYYTGEYTIIRRDKLAMLNASHRTLRALQTPQPENCPKCGTTLKQMPCDDFKYCPKCDLPPCD